MPATSQNSPWATKRERGKERSKKREALLNAAVCSFTERGFRATSLDDVTASLIVTKPTIYRNFNSKDEILFECVQRGLERACNAAEIVGRGGDTGRERLSALMHS